MRKFMSALVAAFFVAGILGAVSVTSAAAPLDKPCWSHLDDDPESETFGEQVPVWAMGGGHVQHQEAGLDTLIGNYATRAECEAAFADINAPE